MQENPQTGITEYRLFHMDRILFGSNTILVFKYPLMNRKLKQIKFQVSRENPNLGEEEIENFAQRILIEEGLFKFNPEKYETEEEETLARQTLMTVEDYTEEEVQDDINSVDWDYAYNEILKIEERKINKYTQQADKKLEEQKIKIEEELKRKYEEEQQQNMSSLQQKMDEQQKKSEELKRQMEELEQAKLQTMTPASDNALSEEAIREREVMQQQLIQMQENNERLLNEYIKSQQEAQLLAQEKNQIEERSKKERVELERQARISQQKNEIKQQFKQKIKEVERKIVEANECAKIMKKNISFSYQLVSQISDSLALLNEDSSKAKKDEIQIQVLNFDNDTVLIWSTKKFYDKLEMMKDVIKTNQNIFNLLLVFQI